MEQVGNSHKDVNDYSMSKITATWRTYLTLQILWRHFVVTGWQTTSWQQMHVNASSTFWTNVYKWRKNNFHVIVYHQVHIFFLKFLLLQEGVRVRVQWHQKWPSQSSDLTGNLTCYFLNNGNNRYNKRNQKEQFFSHLIQISETDICSRQPGYYKLEKAYITLCGVT